MQDDSTGSSERSAHGNAGRWFSIEAEARVPSSQLGGEPSACGA
jgi:hypothetical protein